MATATDADAIAMARAKRYILLDIFNIAVGIDKIEKEGTTPDDAMRMPEEQLQAILQSIAEASSKKDVFRLWADANQECAKRGDINALRELLKAKDKRAGELDENR